MHAYGMYIKPLKQCTGWHRTFRKLYHCKYGCSSSDVHASSEGQKYEHACATGLMTRYYHYMMLCTLKVCSATLSLAAFACHLDPHKGLPCNVGEHEVHLTRQLGVGNVDSCCLCKDSKVAGRPVTDVGYKDELEQLVGVVNLEPAR